MCREPMSLTDYHEISDRIYDLGLGLDLREFARYRRCFADEVEIRNPHFSPDEPLRTCTGDEWAATVYRTQACMDYCLHTLTSPAIDLHGDQASVTVIQQARFGLDAVGGADRSYRVGGPLRLGFTRTPAGWRIRRLDFTVTWNEGNGAVFTLARQKAAMADASR